MPGERPPVAPHTSEHEPAEDMVHRLLDLTDHTKGCSPVPPPLTDHTKGHSLGLRPAIDGTESVQQRSTATSPAASDSLRLP